MIRRKKYKAKENILQSKNKKETPKYIIDEEFIKNYYRELEKSLFALQILDCTV